MGSSIVCLPVESTLTRIGPPDTSTRLPSRVSTVVAGLSLSIPTWNPDPISSGVEGEVGSEVGGAGVGGTGGGIGMVLPPGSGVGGVAQTPPAEDRVVRVTTTRTAVSDQAVSRAQEIAHPQPEGK